MKLYSRKIGTISFFYMNLLRVISLCFLISVLLKGISVDYRIYAIPLIFIINISQVFFSRKNLMLLIIMSTIAYSNYSIIYANFISPVNSVYAEIITPEVTNISLNILAIFFCLSIFLFSWEKINTRRTINLVEKKNESAFMIFVISLLLIYVFLFAFHRPQEIGQRGSPQPLYEYSLGFFIMFFYFCGNNKLFINIGLFFILIFSLQNFIFGGRILGLQFLLCVYLIIYAYKIPLKYVLIGFGTLFILFNLIGIVRGTLLYGNFSLINVLRSIADNGFVLDTAYSAYYTSESFVYVHDLLSYSERWLLFEKFIASIFVGIESQYIIQNITKVYVAHSNGGVLPHFLYFYIGGWGILLANLLYSIYLHLIGNLKNTSYDLMKCIGIYVTCHTFRWYLYSPIGLLRGVLFMTIVYYTLNLVYSVVNNRFHL